jgi:uridylate kinase
MMLQTLVENAIKHGLEPKPDGGTLEIKAEIVLMSKNGVDGVYTADPRTDPTARRLDEVTYADALARQLKVVDATAFSLCMDNGLPMIVFGMEGEGNIARAVRGERIGTRVTSG